MAFPNYPDYLDHAYGYENLENSSFFPSTRHYNDNLTKFNFKYLFQRALSVLKFGIPKTWERNFFLNTLYAIGYLIILPTDEFGVIPQFGNIYGYDVQYQPARADVRNPIFDEEGITNKYTNLRIGRDCMLLRLSPTYTGITSICKYYAELLAEAQTSLRVNLCNTKFAYIFGARNKQQAESLKRMYDNLASGETAVFIDKELYDENGKLAIDVLTQDVNAVYIGSQLLNDIRSILSDFDAMVGIPNYNANKKERMIVDEVNMNNFETQALCFTWLEMLRQDIDRINSKYALNLSVNFRKEAMPNAPRNDNAVNAV